MSKAIRIENADLSAHPVRVTTQQRAPDGTWVDVGFAEQIDSATAMTTKYVHSGQRLVIEERAADPAPDRAVAADPA